MKLYYSKGACSLAVRIIAHELGIQLNYEAVDLKTKKTASGEDFWSINPKGSVPALLLDDGSILTENIAIDAFLADSHPVPDRPILTPMQRYRVLEWLSYIATDLHKSFTPLFNPNVPQDLKDSIFIPVLKSKLQYLNKSVEGKQFLMGNDFGLPDAYCFVCLRWLGKFDVDLAEYPDLQKYFDRVKDQPAVQEALAED